MSSTLHIDKESAWMPQSGIFFKVVEEVLTFLKDNNGSYLNELLRNVTENEIPQLDVSVLDIADFDNFTKGVEAALENFITSRLWTESLKAVAELKALLLVNPKIAQIRESRSGSIVINSESVWINSWPG